MENIIVCWDYLGIMENNMETTIMGYVGYIGFSFITHSSISYVRAFVAGSCSTPNPYVEKLRQPACSGSAV